MSSQLLKKVDFPEPGRYVLALSGGVDSVVLLDLLAARDELELVVAHFDHGMRPRSGRDRRFCRRLAKSYGLRFVSEKGRLGRGASENQARQARYTFLFRVVEKQAAVGVISAHHFDDRIETSLFNALRGSGTTGLLGIRPTRRIKRPLLGVRKAELKAYAKERGLQWRQDPSNRDLTYARNFIRRVLVPVTSSQNPDFFSRYSARLEQLEERHYRELRELVDFKSNYVQADKRQLNLKRLPLIQKSKTEQLRILRFLVDSLPLEAEVSARNLAELRRFALTAAAGKSLKLPQLRAQSHRDKVSLRIK